MAETTDQSTPRSAMPQAGPGNGPMIAAGVMFAGGVLAAGIGVGTMAFGGGEVSATAGEGTAVTQPAEGTGGTNDSEGSTGDGGSQGDAPGEVTVTLPDRDGNGIADELEDGDVAVKDPNEGKSDEDLSQGEDGDKATKGNGTEPYVYIIESGDTLTEISAETGTPLGTLVEKNDIQNPNLIYAGAALVISPVS